MPEIEAQAMSVKNVMVMTALMLPLADRTSMRDTQPRAKIIPAPNNTAPR